MSSFFVLEGIDGAGTTTQCQRLAAALEEAGHAVHQTREPSTGPVGRLLREVLAGKHPPNDPTTLSLLFAADRADHLAREVKPALEQGKIVISDRYYHSSLAYQGAAAQRDWIKTLNKHAPAPSCTFFVKVSPEAAAERRDARGEAEEIFDAMETQRKVARGYEEVVASLGDSEVIHVVDGHGSVEEVSDRIVALALAHLS